MNKIIIITAMIMGMSTVAQADLKSDLAYINSQAEACIAKQAVEAYGVNPSTIRDWLKRKPKEFYYTSEKGG